MEVFLMKELNGLSVADLKAVRDLVRETIDGELTLDRQEVWFPLYQGVKEEISHRLRNLKYLSNANPTT